MIKLPIDRTQLGSLVFVVTVAIAFVVCHTTFIFAFVTFGAVIRLILRVQAFALFAVQRDIGIHK